MAKSNLLKEAIADAKAVRETALANARLRMEEAFTPRLQSMISAKLQNEIEGEEEEEIVDEPIEEPMDAPVEEPMDAPIEEPMDEPIEEPIEEPMDEPMDAPVEEPVEIETEPEVDLEVEPAEDDIEEEGYELDLESIIRELEDESNIEDEIEEPMFTESEEEDEEDEDKEELEEGDNTDDGMKTDKDVTSNLTGNTGPKAGGGQQISPDRGKPFSTEKGGEGRVSSDLNQVSKNAIYEDDDMGEDEEINLDEILRELEEADLTASVPDEIPDASNPFKTMNEQLRTKVGSLTKDLKEHRQVIKFLKSKLNEVNLLNAKLLFTSKLFKSQNMNNSEKMKVIESFDRAKTLREVKLVYSTIAESVSSKNVVDSKKVAKKITESIGGASRPVASTRPVVKKVIKEGIVSESGAERLQKLAGIKIKK